MKIKLILVLFCSLVLANCSVNNQQTEAPQNYQNLWHLINVNGGIAGVNEDFELETIIWSFDEANLKLTVTNNNTDDTIQDGLDSGVYDYSISELDGGNLYIVIDTNEYGLLTFSQNGMSINGNQLSTGSVADGFTYSFQIEVILVE